ncbi:MAG: hypothetical protein FJ082_03520 [Cyanobacteria bacterium K_Offshore_surface_m2_011]|nr:hypothetical protein [Cyanobacteria bacterium K_Offshore_surface_m2_011]
MKTKIPVLICIDVEPDEFFVSRQNPEPWRGYELTHAYIGEWRSALQQRTGDAVHVSWFIRMDPQVALAHGRASWAVEHYPELFQQAIEAGDELGAHVHTYRCCGDSGDWLDDHGNDDWVAEWLDTAVEGYQSSFGRTCRSLRFGNYWSGTEAINRAEALGFRFDLTIEPGLPPNALDARKPAHSGELPDYYRVSREPYAPSRSDFRRRARPASVTSRFCPSPPPTSATAGAREAWGRDSGGCATTVFSTGGRTPPFPCGGTGDLPTISAGCSTGRSPSNAGPIWPSPFTPTPPSNPGRCRESSAACRL